MKQTIHLLLCLALSALLFNKQVQAQGIAPPWGAGTPPTWATNGMYVLTYTVLGVVQSRAKVVVNHSTN